MNVYENETKETSRISIIIPAKNEGVNLKKLLPELCELYPLDEIIVVDDGSTDDSCKLCDKFKVKRVHHPYSKGNGSAIKSGSKVAKHDTLVFLDADGQHRPKYIKNLIAEFDNGYDMVIASRSSDSHSSFARRIANSFYNKLSSYMVGHKIDDLTSGFRAVKASVFKRFLFLLPNGFSYPTTITMALFRTGYNIKFVPVRFDGREGKSHIKLIKDGLKFLLIIFRVTTLYSPLKIFFPVSVGLFITGLTYYGYTYLYFGRFTNMGIFILITSMLVFLIGLISEQITFLIYSKHQKRGE